MNCMKQNRATRGVNQPIGINQEIYDGVIWDAKKNKHPNYQVQMGIPRYALKTVTLSITGGWRKVTTVTVGWCRA